MATTNDIDTKSIVRKFLENRTVVDKEDRTADSADEIQAILESIALSFLLYPQASLSFVLRAKNVLQQVVSKDIEILEYILAAIKDIDNPDDPITDTSDLIEAQTALVEVDRLGRVDSDVRAYDRYTQAINRFLDKRLAKSLKRHRRGELERTGTEARQDLFRVLAVFGPVHGLMVSRLELLLDSVSNFESVALTKIVSTRTLSRVRSSLDKVLQSINRGQLSKTAAAVELLAGAAALSSISNVRNVYDPTISTGDHPSGRVISVQSETVAATATGTGSSVDLGGVSTPWVFGVITDPDISGGTSYSVTLPTSGASGRHYVKPATGSATYDISASACTLYVQFDGITPVYPDAAMVRAVTLPTGGAVTVAAILTALNDGVTGLIDGTAVQIGTTGKILIYGSASVTGITIRASVPGTFDGLGNYTDAAGSVHAVLGFSDDQESGEPDVFSPTDIVDLISPYVPTADFEVTDDGNLQISSQSTELLSSLAFSGVASNFGLSANYYAQPSYLELFEDGNAIDPTELGVFVGSVVSVSDVSALSTNDLFAPVETIDSTKLFFAPGTLLPRCTADVTTIVRVVSPLVYAVQSLFLNIKSYRTAFDDDIRDLQRVLTPLLSKPTLAQINDAVRTIEGVRDTANELLAELSATVVRPDRSEFETVAVQITAALEERGLDRALELLQSGQFAEFFALTSEEASKASRFLKASEQVGRNELGSTTVEQDITDLEPKGTTPDDDILNGEELPEGDDR